MARLSHPLWLGMVVLASLSTPAAAVSFFEGAGEASRGASVNGTTIAQPLSAAACFQAVIPGRWHIRERGTRSVRLAAMGAGGEVEIASRSARELAGWPQGDLVVRDAARLQHDHEQLIGRPAQWTETKIIEPGARWRASWLDDAVSGSAHALNFETYIVPLSREWLLEVSFSGESPVPRELFIGAFAESLRYVHGTACRPPA